MLGFLFTDVLGGGFGVWLLFAHRLAWLLLGCCLFTDELGYFLAEWDQLLPGLDSPSGLDYLLVRFFTEWARRILCCSALSWSWSHWLGYLDFYQGRPWHLIWFVWRGWILGRVKILVLFLCVLNVCCKPTCGLSVYLICNVPGQLVASSSISRESWGV